MKTTTRDPKWNRIGVRVAGSGQRERLEKRAQTTGEKAKRKVAIDNMLCFISRIRPRESSPQQKQKKRTKKKREENASHWMKEREGQRTVDQKRRSGQKETTTRKQKKKKEHSKPNINIGLRIIIEIDT